jgi:hypothetical protein
VVTIAALADVLGQGVVAEYPRSRNDHGLGQRGLECGRNRPPVGQPAAAWPSRSTALTRNSRESLIAAQTISSKKGHTS